MAYVAQRVFAMGSTQRSGDSPQDAIDLECDEPAYSVGDQRVVDIERLIHEYRPQSRNNSLRTDISGLDEQKEEDIVSEELANFIDLTVDDDPVIIVRSRKRRRDPAPRAPERNHDKIKVGGGLWIKLNTLYELNPECTPKLSIENHFILVTAISENLWTQEYTIRGLPFSRSRTLMAKLPRKLNEVFAIYELEEEDDRAPEDQACIEVAISALLRPRTLHLTNASYPQHRYDPKIFWHRTAVEKEGPLVCRWKLYVHYRNSNTKRDRKANHWSLERIRAHEVVRDEFRVPEEALRESWRGQTIRGGSHMPEARGPDACLNTPKQQYTVFDSFCGAGGFSRGAERAGLHIEYAIDHWEKACATYRLNFPKTNLFEMSIDELMLASKNTQMRTDILHLSPPCQTWSPAHTVAGANDEANIAALFACRSLVEKLRPRIFTLEQTFGILQSCHDPFFCSLVGGFTELGYSVTWKIVHLQTWGLPQTRKRLIMIGACPGEKLPPFPSATHSKTGTGGLSKYVTIRQALAKIKVTSTFHNPEEEIKDTLPLGSVVSDPDQILRRCVTCSGGQNMHWSNTRSYTVREFASLQGFPVWHQFADAPKSALKKQIGNAFPSCVVRLLCEHLKNWLLVEDGLAPARKMRSSVGGRELVFVSEGPRRAVPPPVLMTGFRDIGRSQNDAILLNDDEIQVEIKYDHDLDVEMADVLDAPPSTPDTPNTPTTPDTPATLYTARSRSRSRTMSIGGTPEPMPAGGSKDTPIVFD
ncbi:modification methylase HphIA [Colletotrichum spaethianum]|uniref:DNA (cytosine-5-)-methyltransferase n=1 Tax=Colletotrichum spaethianum TaxID=700344 RepID=A0AA37L601_9PEZI|nr:modification methylase HphIA [Colletotrichum spaethianum]GKT42482.1 modification methylase HphIA [Colletotrichum spaethianum]